MVKKTKQNHLTLKEIQKAPSFSFLETKAPNHPEKVEIN
jgi:hypothetical protein